MRTKNIIPLMLTLFMATASGKLLAQWQQSGTVEYTTGLVGIGVSNPDAALHIKANGSIPLHLFMHGTSGGQPVTLTQFSAPGTSGNTGAHVAKFSASTNGIDATGSYFSIMPINSNGMGWAKGLTVFSGGKVGIGTENPLTKLSIYDINTTPVLNIVGAGGFGQVVSELRLTNYYEGLAGHRAAIQAVSDVNGSSGFVAMRFNTSKYENSQHQEVEAMRISSAGKVGIGTANPLTKLSIYDINTTPVLNIVGVGNYGQVISELRLTNYYEGLAGHRAAIQAIGDASGSNGFVAMRFNTSKYENSQHQEVEAMRITSAGKVGIGTSSPENKLDVMSPFVANEETSVFVGQDHNFGASTGRYGIGISFQHIDATANGKRYHINTWFSDTKSRVMSFDYTGKVGIGTMNPDAKLTVNGDIHAKEVRVDVNIPVPDYVFEPDYDLATLAEIETYIKENKHLPEVPSAKEMEENGMNLKEMNLLLLKKVEELTLHLIEQNQTIEGMTKRIEQLENAK